MISGHTGHEAMIDSPNNLVLFRIRGYGNRNIHYQVTLYTEYHHAIFFRTGDFPAHARYPEKEAKAHGGLFDMVVYSGMVFQQPFFRIQRSRSKPERDKNQLRNNLF